MFRGEIPQRTPHSFISFLWKNNMKDTMDRVQLDWGKLPFDYMKTDCHLEYRFDGEKWDEGTVVEDDRISISMASTCLHYGQECFEGLKVFETKDGRALTFRPEENGRRMIRTAKKVLMVAPPEEVFVDAVDRVVKLNRRYIPPYGSGASLYIRPLLLGVTGTVGIKPSQKYLFVVFATPVGPYFPTGLKPVKLWVEEEIDRAAPNGVGDAKLGGNYAAGLRAATAAKAKGFAEALYLDAREKKYIDELGAANFFGITKDGVYVTPQSPSILPSITNRSLQQIARDLGITVEHRPVEVSELANLAEAGCVGTAAIITPVQSIQYRDQSFVYTGPDEVGPVTKKLYDTLTGIQAGDIEDKHGWTREITLD